MTLLKLSSVVHTQAAFELVVDLLLGRYIALTAVFTPGCEIRPDARLSMAVRRTVQAGYLDVDADHAGVQAFVAWLREQPDDPDGMIASFLERMAREFPSPVWQG
jgi:hypothetical protein